MESGKREYFDQHYRQYDTWYEEHTSEYEDQVNFISSFLPEGNGIEIGVGTGRFAARLGIRHGIDTSEQMVQIARERGVDALVADAIRMPFRNKEFDFSLNVVTICFLEKPFEALIEAKRISKKVVTVILDRESEYIKSIMDRKDGFYKYARFYSTSELLDLYDRAGFKEIEVRQQTFSTSDGKKYILVGLTGS